MSASVWVTKRETEKLTGHSSRWIERQADAGALPRRDGEQRAANGRPVPEYDVSALVPQVISHDHLHRFLLARAARESASTALATQSADNQPSLFPAPKTGARWIVPAALEPIAQQRLEVIKPLLDWDSAPHPLILGPGGKPVQTKREAAEALARLEGVSARTLWRRAAAYRERNDAGLVREVRSDRGKSRFFQKRPEAAQWVLAKYAESRHISDVVIWESLVRAWPTLYQDGARPPSVATIRGLLRGLPKPIADIPRLTRQQHDAKYAPYLTTNIAELRPNQIWVSDHRIYDVILFNDCFDAAPHYAALRLWETCIEDMRTRVIVGSVWSASPSSRSIASALRQAIARFGLPEVFYCDNGKDFRKVGGGWRLTPQDLDDGGRVRILPGADNLLKRLGVTVKYCVPRHPQSKQIESYFSTVSKRFDVLFGKTYAGRKPSERPDECRLAEKQHKQWLAGERRDTPLIAASIFIQLHQQWTQEFNAAHPHSGRGMNGRAPLEVMNELAPPAQRQIPNMLELEPLFWDRLDRTVANAMIKIGRWEYEGADSESAAAMYLANGQIIRVARDPADIAFAVACDSEGRAIARLQCKELVARGPQSLDKIQAIQKLRGRLNRASRQFWKVARAGVPTELELLAERGGIVPATIEAIAPALPDGAAVARPRPVETSTAVYKNDVVRELRALLNEDRPRPAAAQPAYTDDLVARLRAAESAEKPQRLAAAVGDNSRPPFPEEAAEQYPGEEEK